MCSQVYGFLVSLRNLAYDRKWFKAHKITIPVISIGNLVAGGGGKTPFTLFLSEILAKKFQVAILSRGYGSLAEKKEIPSVMSRGTGPLLTPQQGGDEPYLMARRMPYNLLIVGRDRVLSARTAEKMGAEAIILDDGMQHRRLARNVEIVLINASSPWGNTYLLPRGLLRERPSSLKRAHLIVISKGANKQQFEEIEREIKPFANCPIIGTTLHVDGFYNETEEPISLPQGTKVGVFCGVANPSQVIQSVASKRLEIVENLSTADHSLPTPKQLVTFAHQVKAKGGQCLITTEKDQVKLPTGLNLPLPILSIRVRPKVVFNEQKWKQFLKSLGFADT